MTTASKHTERKDIVTNRRAFHNFAIEEKFEAGIALKGTEVKSLREGKANLQESYAAVDKGRVTLHHCHIGAYSHGNQMNHEPMRPRTLLLHRKQINKLMGKVQQQGMTIIPLRMYFNERGIAKVELALARGKKHHDKREAIKSREAGREIERALKQKRRER